MPDEGQYYRDMYHILTKLTKSVMVDSSSTHDSFHTVYHKGAIPRKRKYSVSYGAQEAERERCLKHSVKEGHL
jgi:hypothetical protein